jgi:hypothetical protein
MGVDWDTQPPFSSFVEAKATIVQGTNKRGDVVRWDITKLVRKWLDGEAPNYGIVLRDPTSEGFFRGVQFAAREGLEFGVPGAAGLTGPRLLVTRLKTLTDGEPKGGFGEVGGQTDEITEPGNWRLAPYFYGLKGIDWTKLNMCDGCGYCHDYAIGYHQGDLIEYLMKFGGSHDRLVLRGIADRPGPVRLKIYVDGEYRGAAEWGNNNNCNQDAEVRIGGIPYGNHAIAVQFVNDYNKRGLFSSPDRDRNMFLHGLFVR